ncbi:MAG TPA: FAD-dependent oxidoreductase, partial [Candidatus Cloacimonadota bacterium]|nr:FAD-dependent oxidoreductase [Candidatus Cloacimonadota bacterium]
MSDHYADCEAPCKIACPDHVDIQAYIAAIANNDYHQAVKIIKDTLPMPLSIGRVCPAFCEDECRRTIVDEPIAICKLKRYAADLDLGDIWSYIPDKAEYNGKKVAIIGAGPSGLTCGFYLSNQGYQVDVFESSPQAGGWLRYGIPEYRLPKAILDKEIQLMCSNGMKIHCNSPIGNAEESSLGIAKLSKDYDAVYVAIGAQKAVDMPLPGNDLNGVFLGVDYLKSVALGTSPDLGKRVAIIGGGNTAIDCARTAKRYGANVTVIYRRTREEMPADGFEIDAAYEEGVVFYPLMNPVEYIASAESPERLHEIRIEKMLLGDPDISGRRSPIPTGSYITEQFDSVIAAISQIPE